MAGGDALAVRSADIKSQKLEARHCEEMLIEVRPGCSNRRRGNVLSQRALYIALRARSLRVARFGRLQFD